MNKMVTMVLLLGLALLGFSDGDSQVLLLDNFDYPAGNALTGHGWSVVQGGSNVSSVASSGLTYTGYGASGLGNAALLDQNSGAGHEDLARSFTNQTTGDIYVSFLLNASAVDMSASFNFPLYLSAASGSGGWGRVYIDVDGNSNVRFGLSQFVESAAYTTFSFSLNTTYLIVLKYTLNGGASNDQASLFVFTDPTLPATEPDTPTVGPVSSGATDPSGIARVVIRRAGVSNNNILLDGIGVTTSWGEAPLPVELISFTSAVEGNDVTLNWATVSETNNFGFEVERWDPVTAWRKLAFVPGHGTTLRPQQYAHIDQGVASGAYRYRLKQVDTNGDFEYSASLNVNIGRPATTRLVQNYPNPFNPSTQIVYSLQAPGQVLLKVFDLTGRAIRTLVNESQEIGEYSVTWDGRDNNQAKMASGIYFYALQIDSKTVDTRRMLMVK